MLAALPHPGKLSPRQVTRAGATDSEGWREAEARQVLLGLPWLSPSQGLQSKQGLPAIVLPVFPSHSRSQGQGIP